MEQPQDKGVAEQRDSIFSWNLLVTALGIRVFQGVKYKKSDIPSVPQEIERQLEPFPNSALIKFIAFKEKLDELVVVVFVNDTIIDEQTYQMPVKFPFESYAIPND